MFYAAPHLNVRGKSFERISFEVLSLLQVLTSEDSKNSSKQCHVHIDNDINASVVERETNAQCLRTT